MMTIATRRAEARAVWLRLFGAVLLSVSVLAVPACIQANPPTDVGNPVAPSTDPSSSSSSSSNSGTSALAYTPDMQPLFQSDCVVCHGGSRPSANYSMSTYAGVMKDVQAGNAQSRLVVWTQPGGTMYRFWTGNAATKASMVKQWVVTDKAQQTR